MAPSHANVPFFYHTTILKTQNDQNYYELMQQPHMSTVTRDTVSSTYVSNTDKTTYLLQFGASDVPVRSLGCEGHTTGHQAINRYSGF